ncbi:NB-ARC - like 10 [Theobroma cacao]|nr:NB-ARC - like 10 [Theobroma cacao]
MHDQESFIGLLSGEEAWNLFKKIAGEGVETAELRSIAIKIANACAGLPIAISTVGRALRNKSLFEWIQALHRLRRPSSPDLPVYSTIELSFKFLHSEELRLTFLICSQMSHEALVLDLMQCTIGLGLFLDRHSIKETRDAVLARVSELKASSLLCNIY